MPHNCRPLAFAVALLALIPAIWTPASADPISVTLVHVNDWDRMEGVDGRGGAAKIAAVVSEERVRAEKEGGLAIVTFGGDMISPSLLSGLDRGEHMIELANAIGFDIAVLGNHEFDFGPEVLKERLEQSQTVWLAGNVRYRGEPGFPGAGTVKIVEHGGYRIGFLGLVTPETVKISSPGKDVTFTPFVETGAALAAELREAGADLVVALTHNDLAHDLELLRVSGGIDAVLGGHDHLAVAWYDGRQTVLKAGSQGVHVGVLRLTLDRVEDRRGNLRPVWTPDYELRSTEDVKDQPALAAAVEKRRKQLDSSLNIAVGKTTTELDTRRASVRSGENAFGNLVADAMRIAVGADIALTNGGGIRGDTVYPAGSDITGKLVLTELPFGNRTVKLALTGAEVREALEHGVAGVENASGAFPHVSGLRFSFDASRPKGGRVVEVFVGDAPLEPEKTYTLATNDFLARGGDRYAMFEEAERRIGAKDSSFMAAHVMEFVETVGTVSPAIEGRVTRLD
ncbi:MAG: 5'-nucleotidase C-terminal domain-containing protein [Alphaproteobacteria bacterium]|nr:5'-nucleotidase C-terminal domain-containing protein [Alphaproteobacteria bacterium]